MAIASISLTTGETLTTAKADGAASIHHRWLPIQVDAGRGLSPEKIDESWTIRVVPSEYTLLKPPAPFSMNIELTSLCNQKCVMCPLTARNTLSSRNIGHMAPATWRRVLVAARRVGQVQ